jgi:Ca2+-binding RTX toxin-like protein
MTGTAAIDATDNVLNNYLRGNDASNVLTAGAGNDILEGAGGADTLIDTDGNGILLGGSGADSLTASSGNDLLVGGLGDDAINTGAGADIIAFNKGDGVDIVAASTGSDNTLSIGGGALYADLLFQKIGNDLLLKIGASDQIRLSGYYSSTENRSVNTLQMIIEGTSDYVSGSADVTRDNKVERFNLEGLVAAFDAARVANPSLTTWALSSALVAQYVAGSDTDALGGDLAYRYGRFGNLSDVSFTPASGILGSGSFGAATQTLQPLTSLQDTTPRLS